jgi:hypothetical protein
MPRSNENKSCMRVDESWKATVCMRVFSTLMSWSNENKSPWESGSENLHHSFLDFHAPVKREQELHESCTWVGRILLRGSENSHPLSSKFEPVQNQRKFIRTHESWWELALKHQRRRLTGAKIYTVNFKFILLPRWSKEVDPVLGSFLSQNFKSIFRAIISSLIE